jgi:hypothetical protein
MVAGSRWNREPHRRRTGREELWLRPNNRRLGASEWRLDRAWPLWIARTERITLGLERLSTWLNLPAYQGKSWNLSTHPRPSVAAPAIDQRKGLDEPDDRSPSGGGAASNQASFGKLGVRARATGLGSRFVSQ